MSETHDGRTMNSKEWWEDFHAESWEANRGGEQTEHFMVRLIESLPPDLAKYMVRARPASKIE